MSWSPPPEIKEFRLERPLGSGSYGDVWLARDTLLDRAVALKVASAALGDLERARFRVEARAVARLSHPNVLAVHQAGEVDGHPYLVTELLEGKILADLPLPLDAAKAMAIGLDLARGLAAAHRAGVFHRDIKPANAFLTDDGVAKLLDFGLAKLHDMPDELAATAAPSPESLGLSDTAAAETLSGRAAGTPLYMAPETWRAEPPTRRTDVYSLGAVLFELLAGRAPIEATTVHELHRRALAGEVDDLSTLLASARAPSPPAPLAALVMRCLSLDPNARPDAHVVAEALDLLLDAAASPSTAVTVAVSSPFDPAANPYRGLLAFGPEHRSLFFGRDAEIAAVLAELAARPFVLVVGASGAGKSSLVRAGVLPRVTRGAFGSTGQPRKTVIVVPGGRPLEALAQSVAPELGLAEDAVLEELAASPTWLAQALRATGARVLLFVDQLEEVWTLAPEPERAAFFAILTALALGRAARVVATVRDDFLPRLEDLGALQQQALGGAVVLGPLSSEGLTRAIVEPARLSGVTFDAALTERLVREAQRGSLPLLQFALARLWEWRARHDPASETLDVEALDAVGGVDGALAAQGDETLARMPPAERAVARKVLLSLVTVEGTRARREESELLALAPGTSARAALDALVAGRLLVVGAGEAAASYEVAHEALVTGWPALRAWLAEESEARREAERVRVAAAEWERLGKGEAQLFGPRQLARLSRVGLSLPKKDQAFVDASRAGVTRARRRRWTVGVAFSGALAILVGGVVGLRRWQEHRETHAIVAARLAEANAAETEANELDAKVEGARREAFVRYDANDWDGGEARWKEALALAKLAGGRFAAASTAANLALARDPRDPSGRALAADLSLRWLLTAERDHEPRLVRDLSASLPLVDDDGSRMARLNAPAHVRAATSPPGAAVVLHRIDVDDRGLRVEDDGHAIALNASLELKPGSYMLTASAPGRYPTRYPLRLLGADDVHIEIALPEASAVPPGFVYVPAGSAFFGAPDVESVRLAYSAQPEHRVHVDAFFIAEHETTYAEYLAFLASLPPADRDERRPHVGGDFDLVFRPDGVPVLTLYGVTVRPGEPLCRPKRSIRRCQDWLRMPVAGLSWDDASTYAAWLARTRVPGARLCTEREWERAARGADERTFPWGDVAHSGDANFDATYNVDADQEGEDEVGSFPIDRSPLGVFDLGGNLAEWVADTIDGTHAGRRVSRGGDWNNESFNARPAYRSIIAAHRNDDVGLRSCVSPRTP